MSKTQVRWHHVIHSTSLLISPLEDKLFNHSAHASWLIPKTIKPRRSISVSFRSPAQVLDANILQAS